MPTRASARRFLNENLMRLGTGVVFGLVLGLVLFQAQKREPLLSSALLQAQDNTSSGGPHGYGYNGCGLQCGPVYNGIGAYGTQQECEDASSSACAMVSSSGQRMNLVNCHCDPAANGTYSDITQCLIALGTSCTPSSGGASSNTTVYCCMNGGCGAYAPPALCDGGTFAGDATCGGGCGAKSSAPVSSAPGECTCTANGCNPLCQADSAGNAGCTMPAGKTCADLCGKPYDCSQCPENPKCPQNSSQNSSQRCCSGNVCV